PVAKNGAPSGRMEEAAKQAPSSAAADSVAPSETEARRSRPELAQRDDKRLGTGHGEREYSPTTQTAFERASSSPAEIVQVRYDSFANLLASGVIPRAPAPPRQPNAFPSFVPDPG